jgi:hypothetical protein
MLHPYSHRSVFPISHSPAIQPTAGGSGRTNICLTTSHTTCLQSQGNITSTDVANIQKTAEKREKNLRHLVYFCDLKAI